MRCPDTNCDSRTAVSPDRQQVARNHRSGPPSSVTLCLCGEKKYRFFFAHQSSLPEGLPVVVAEQEFILTALDLTRENRVHALKLPFHSGDLENIALVKNQIVLRDEFAQREMDLDGGAVAELQDQVRAHAAADRAGTVFHFVDGP